LSQDQESTAGPPELEAWMLITPLNSSTALHKIS
jgi:hypothetical protein